LHERGQVYCPERAEQLRDYSGLALPGGVTPTDVDGYIEIHDKLYIMFELKHTGAEVPYGQELALQRMADALADAGKEALLCFAYHDAPPGSVIIAHDAIVFKSRYRRGWNSSLTGCKLGDVVQRFYNYVFDQA
jgi:hypothetical protein